MSKWYTTPLEASDDSGNIVIASVKEGIDGFRSNPRFKFRVEVSWTYDPDTLGMPSDTTAETMEQVTEVLEKVFKADPVAVLTGVYTGAGARDMVFYTLSLHIFQRKFNEALAHFPPLPLEFSAEEDPLWDEYTQMEQLARQADSEVD